jgi:hypothetical protein
MAAAGRVELAVHKVEICMWGTDLLVSFHHNDEPVCLPPVFLLAGASVPSETGVPEL